MRVKQVQIPAETFADLAQWFLIGNREPEREERIKRALNAKFDAMQQHERYTAYKTAPDPAQRAKARQEYVSASDILPDFQWHSNTTI